MVGDLADRGMEPSPSARFQDSPLVRFQDSLEGRVEGRAIPEVTAVVAG
jgi:hypothetical protein